jgi:hypothetical protein
VADVTLALVNGRIRTGDPRRPVADAMAISSATLALVGSSAEVRKFVGKGPRVIDMKGGTVVALPHSDAVLRRGAPASFAVFDSGTEFEHFRMLDGTIVLDEFA